MAKGQESISFEALKALVERAQAKPLKNPRTENVGRVEWRVLNVEIPNPGGRSVLGPDIPVVVVSGIYYRPGGAVTARDVLKLRDKHKRALFGRQTVVAAADGFAEDAMKVFRRSKRIDYVSETHWPNGWPSVPETK
jgi:hypothetical protein